MMKNSVARRARRQEIPVVIEAKVVGPYSLELTFADGLRKRLNLESRLYGEVFEPLRDPAFFDQVSIDPVAGTVVWPNGADFAPEFLHDWEPDTASEPGSEQQTASAPLSKERRRYAVVFEKAAHNYTAYVPDLPGCVATGATREEVERNIREAIAFHLEGLGLEDEPIPEPQAWTELVEV